MRAFLAKSATGFKPACEVSEKAFRKMDRDELLECDIKSRNTRSVAWHRRYWALCRLCYQNSEQFKSEDDVHWYLKCETHTFDKVIQLESGERIYFVKSIAFDQMTADEWAVFWKKALDVLYRNVIPGIDRDEALAEIDRCAGMAAAN
jgi:hypothetical protein